ncbi:MAG: dTMP kinase [Bacilli bacterium]|nr:dTMP kinase [Bacilli bacterium]
MKGLFITFEGCEGSGKTSVITKLTEYLENKGYKVYKTREPGGSKIAEDIRNVILDVNNTNMDKITEALLYAASRRQHLVEKVIPYLNDGYIVICDRYLDSSLAYQGHARGIGIDKVYDINISATEGLLPDLTVYMDVEPKIGLNRIHNNNREQNRLDLEKINFHEKVYEGYDIIRNKFKDRIKSIDASKNQEEVLKDTIKLVEDFIESRK